MAMKEAVCGDHSASVPILALGSGVTLAATLNVLHHTGIQTYALCPPTDFVRHSRWFRPLPTGLPNPQPADLEALLESLDLASAALLPCSDDWLRAVASLPARVARRFPSSISPACVDLVTDKWRFAQTLADLAIPRPRTQLISSRPQLDTLPDFHFAGAILKPLSSVHFASKYGVKGYLVQSRAEAAALADRLELPIMLQEFIPGPPNAGYFVDGFRDRYGRITALFARRRLRMFPAKLGNSTLIESVPTRNLHRAILPLEHLLEEISYRGIFSAEFKFDERDRTFKLIEINGRPWWYVEFANRSGVDVLSMAYRDALGLSVPSVCNYQVGRRAVFTLNDLRGWRQQNGASPSLPSLLESWLTSDSTPFHWNDPLPALSYLRQTCAAFLRTRHSDSRPAASRSAEVTLPTESPELQGITAEK